MQINDLWVDNVCKDLDLYDPKQNFRCAYKIFHATTKTFNPWVAYKKNKDICTTDYEIKMCPEPKIIDNLEEEGFEPPKAIVRSAIRVCRDKYYGCLKRLIRTGERAYHAVCGGV
jgi:hypothetical protein